MPKILSQKYDANQLWLPLGDNYLFSPIIDGPPIFEPYRHASNVPTWIPDEAKSSQRIFGFSGYIKRITHKQFKAISSHNYPTFDRVDKHDQNSGLLKLSCASFRYSKAANISGMFNWLEENLRNRFYVNMSRGFVVFETRRDYVYTKMAGILT